MAHNRDGLLGKGRCCLAFAFLLAAAMTGSGCMTFIIKGDVLREADGWTIVLENLTQGPNSVPTGSNSHAIPEDGEQFLWAWMKIRNDIGQARPFGYDSCEMDLDDEEVLPALVGRLFGVVERSEVYGPGESRDRRLIFSYPRDRLPTRIKCGNMIFEVPGPSAKAPVKMARR